MLWNNLCQKCNNDKENGIDIKARVVRFKIDPSGESTSDMIEVCVHPQNEEFPTQGSIMDLGICTCGMRGFLYAPEEQIGILVERNEFIQTLELYTEDMAYSACNACKPDKVCEDCGTTVRKLHTFSSTDGIRSVCGTCLEFYTPCNVCGVKKKFAGTSSYICESCSENWDRCNKCGNFRKKDTFKMFNGQYHCASCVVTSVCSICETTNVLTIINDSIRVCEICSQEFINLPSIGSYGRTTVNEYMKTPVDKNTKTFFGIENEVQIKIERRKKDNFKFRPERLPINKRLIASLAKSVFPSIDVKRDGSLQSQYSGRTWDNGVELVWQPMSWKYIKEQIPSFRKMFEGITPYLAKNMHAAGMHIHISKRAFTPFHFMKFSVFFYTAEKENLIQYIAGRSYCNYARRHYRKSSPGEYGKGLAIVQEQLKGKYAKRITEAPMPSRYDLINTTGAHTYEVRIFKGARTFEEFMERVEFTHSVYEYTRVTSNKDISLKNYLEWLQKNKKEYVHISNKLKGVNF